MDRFERDLRDCISNIQSGKVTERKKAAKDLTDYLLGHGADSVINRHSVEEDSYDSVLSWNSIFRNCHAAVLQEAEKIVQEFHKSKTRMVTLENNKTLYTSLITTVVSKANANLHLPFLHCNNMVAAVLKVLENEHYKNVIGETYLNILHEWILPSRKYWGTIKSDYWIELYELMCTLYSSPPAKCKLSVIVSTMNMIIKRGCEHSLLACTIKKRIFSFLVNVVNDTITNKAIDFQVSVLTILVTTCEKLQKECRMAICKFGEEVVENVLNMYEGRMESHSNKKRKMFDFLLIVVNVHHPSGITNSVEGAYANSWDDWKRSLRKINYLTVLEVKLIQNKGTIQNLADNFLTLVVAVYKQIFSYCEIAVDVTLNISFNETSTQLDQPNSKRRRILCGYSDIIDRIKQSPKVSDSWPWNANARKLTEMQKIIQKLFSILETLLKTYPETVNETDYLMLLENVDELLSSSKSFVITDYLYRCCISLLTLRNQFDNKSLDRDKEKKLLNSICSIVLRIIGLQQNVEWSNKLLIILLPTIFNPEIADSILKLYMYGVVRLSEHSLVTLQFLRQRMSFPEMISNMPNQDQIWSVLLRWMLPDVTTVNEWNLPNLPIDILSQTIALVILKNNSKKKFVKGRPLNLSFTVEDRLSVSQINLLTTFDADLLVPKKKQTNVKPNDSSDIGYVLNGEACSEFLVLLKESSKLIIEYNSIEENRLSAAPYVTSFILLLINFQQIMEFYEIAEHKIEVAYLLDTMSEELLTNMGTLFAKDLDFIQTIDFLRNLQQFFEQMGTVPLHISETVLERLIPVLKLIEKFTDSNKVIDEDETDNVAWEDNENKSLFDYHRLLNSEKIRIEACKMLLYFCYNFENNTANQRDILNSFLNELIDLQENSSSICLLQMSVISVKTVFQLSLIDMQLFCDAIFVIQVLCKHDWHTIEESAIVILNLLKDAIEMAYTVENVNVWNHLIPLFEKVQKILNKSGPAIVRDIVHCLGSFDKIDKHRKCSWNEDENEFRLIGEDVLKYLDHSFYEVRIAAVSYVASVFNFYSQTNETHCADEVNRLFSDLCNSLENSFIVQGTLTVEEVDETVNRPVTVLYSLACVICCSIHARRKALFLLLCLTHEKKFNSGVIRKIFKLIERKLKLADISDFLNDNILYVMWLWYQKYKSFTNFPFAAIGFSSKDTLYRQYLNKMVPILMYHRDTTGLVDITNTLQISITDLISNDCFPDIMALLIPVSQAFHAPSEEENEDSAQMHDAVISTIGNDAVEELTSSRLPEVLISMIRNLHDPQYEICENASLPTPAYFTMERDHILKTISHLQSTSTNPEMPLIVLLSHEYPDYIQKMFQQLNVDVLNASTVEIKLFCFQKYAFLCEMFKSAVDSLVECGIYEFVVRTVVRNILNFIETDPEEIYVALSCVQFLNKLVGFWIAFDKAEINSTIADCLPNIAETLIPLVYCGGSLGLAATELLQNLLASNCGEIIAAVNSLDPFPESSEFRILRAAYTKLQVTSEENLTLRDVVKQFLNPNVSTTNVYGRVEGLKRLQKMISKTNIEELNAIFKRSNSDRGFSEYCSNSLIHNLICVLIQLVNSNNHEVQYEAADCLGKIGLIDLQTLVLKPNCSSYVSPAEPELKVAMKCCELFKDFIVDRNINLLRTTSEALYSILSTLDFTNGLSSDLKEMYYPFVSARKSNSKLWDSFKFDKFLETANDVSLWSPDGDISHDEWITNLVCTLLDSFEEPSFLHYVKAVCHLKVSLVEELLPYVVHLLLNCSYSETNAVISNCMNKFFKHHTLADADLHRQNTIIQLNKSSVQCLLNVVEFIRFRQKKADSCELKLNFLYVAKAAQYCSAYFTSVLYCELWINSQIREFQIPNDGSILFVLDEIGKRSLEDKNLFLNILGEAFTKIGDSDALHGCSSSLLVDTESRILHSKRMGNWYSVMEMSELQLGFGNAKYEYINDITSAMQFIGYLHTERHYLDSLSHLDDAASGALYDCAWRLGAWDVREPCDDRKTYDYHHYAAVRDACRQNYAGARWCAVEARRCAISSMESIGLEAAKNVYAAMGRLQCLQDIEDFTNASDLNSVIDKWQNQNRLNNFMNFKYVEPYLSQRVSLLLSKQDIIHEDYILDVIRFSRSEKSYHHANAYITLSKKNLIPNSLFHMKLTFEEAKILWDRGESYTARYILDDLLKTVKNKEDARIFHSVLLRMYGSWLAEKNLVNADTILDEYYLPAIEMLGEGRDKQLREREVHLETYHCVSEYADLQYQNISKYVKSESFEMQMKSVSSAQKEAEELSKHQTAVVRNISTRLANQSKLDDSLVKSVRNKENRYLVLAMRYHLKALETNPEEDLRVFRIISMWLDNKKNIDLHIEIKQQMFQIPSFKFVLALPQLIAHITRLTAECFGYCIDKLIEKCALEHPHHTLPLLLLVANFRKDKKYDESDDYVSSHEERILAANNYISKFQENEKINKILSELELLSDAYIKFACYSLENKKVPEGMYFKMPSSLSITKIRNLKNVSCPTITLPVSKTCEYNVTGVVRFEPNFAQFGGINAPKKVLCFCTDGIKRPQLIKKDVDDMRQDAITQQVFAIMNKLLSQNKRTYNRNLLLRTYKIVPLSQLSGVLEFCENTTKFGDYLVGKPGQKDGAHERYRPGDISPNSARMKLIDAHGGDDEALYSVFVKVCSKIKPVFRYFFIEKFPSPTMWFERRLAYIHSVAVVSMVGYIIGLGDRHVNNILIDNHTAEVIHIDFGIAFEQGLLLKTPEFIPFRLTRDVEDGMGVFALDGIFRRCCEQTLSVLRENKNIIKTTIDVFLYDPLYQWIVTAGKVSKKAGSSKSNASKPVNETAPRALAQIELKLQGLEDGTVTTVEGQVNRLIQQAKDLKNLSKLFHGWQAYL